MSVCASIKIYIYIYNTENLNGERSVDRSVGVDGPARIGSRIVDVQSRDLQLPATDTTILSNLLAVLEYPKQKTKNKKERFLFFNNKNIIVIILSASFRYFLSSLLCALANVNIQ